MSASEQLCMSCGLCCDGTIFANVTLQPGDDPKPLNSSGLPVREVRGRLKFSQPCAAFDGRCCRIYAARPSYCQKFECYLFQKVAAGNLAEDKAHRLIRQAKAKAAKARNLLERLGDTNRAMPLSIRFRRTARRLAEGQLTQADAEVFARLTHVVHSLNLLLAKSFYPSGIQA